MGPFPTCFLSLSFGHLILVSSWQVNDDPDVGEDAYVWLGSLVPLVSDLVNARFTFETLTAPTGHRLHFPAYDKFLKEIDK